LTSLQHLRALTDELTEETKIAAQTPQGRTCIKKLQSNITNILNPKIATDEERRVRLVEQEQQQRVIDDTPITTIERITDAPPIMTSRNPTAKRHLKNTPRTHGRQTRNNTPGAVPLIARTEDHAINTAEYSHDTTDTIMAASMPRPHNSRFTCNAKHNIISTHAINALTTREQCTPNEAFRQHGIRPHPNTLPANMNHYANPMVHPITGEIVSSYKKAMKDPTIGELWKTAFGKEFGGLAQGDNKT
jgi:hypothetical protein